MRLFPAILLMLLAVPAAMAQEFSAQVLPPRFEDSAAPGTVYRNVIEVQNASAKAVRFGVRTADWVVGEDGNAIFDYGLATDTCRRWVGLEASEIRLEGKGRKRFRFEVAVPAGTPAGQCRFAVMIEGAPQATGGGVMVAGRIGVIVYLTLGDAAAQLAVVDVSAADVAGAERPVLQVRNAGNAHGRLAGFVAGVDATGRKWTLVPASDPILPGQTRPIALHPVAEPDGQVGTITFPIQLSGALDWGTQRIPVEATAGK